MKKILDAIFALIWNMKIMTKLYFVIFVMLLLIKDAMAVIYLRVYLQEIGIVKDVKFLLRIEIFLALIFHVSFAQINKVL